MPGWFDENGDRGGGFFADDAQTNTPPPSQGNSRTDGAARITELYQRLFGRNPTERELATYGNNIDDNYLRRIEQQLRGSDEAKNYTKGQINKLYQKYLGRDGTDDEIAGLGTSDMAEIERKISASEEAVKYEQTRGTNTGTTTTGAGDGTNWASADYSNPDTVKAYFKSKGVDLSDSSANYWAQKYNSSEFAGDRNYYFQRLNQAEEFIGPPGSPGNPKQPDYLAPWDEQYTPPTFHPPPAFEAPDPSKVYDDPSFKFRMGEGLKALERSAASKGTLLTGGTLQDEQAFGQNMATAEYDKIYGRAVSEDQTKYGRSVGEYDIGRQNALAQYQDRQSTFYSNEDRPFSKLMQYAGIGSNALNASNQFGSQYVGDYANALMNGTNAANGYNTSGSAANASGIVGSQNAQSQAWAQMLQQWGWLFGNTQGQRRAY